MDDYEGFWFYNHNRTEHEGNGVGSGYLHGCAYQASWGNGWGDDNCRVDLRLDPAKLQYFYAHPGDGHGWGYYNDEGERGEKGNGGCSSVRNYQEG